VADHWQYLAMPGVAALAAAGFVALARRLGVAAKVAGTSTVLVFAVLTWDRAHQFQNAELFWTGVLRSDPDSWAARINLATDYSARGEVARALPLLRDAVALKPGFAEGHCYLGIVLYRTGDIDGAIRECHAAVDLAPRLVNAHYQLALALGKENRTAEAIAEYRQALKIDPRHAAAQQNLTAMLTIEHEATLPQER
jgi:tetratricopeptide (TPR) repeat protein